MVLFPIFNFHDAIVTSLIMLWRSYHAMEELSCYGGAIML